MVAEYKQRAKDIAAGKIRNNTDSGVGMLMNLRKIANHPLLIRNHFDNVQVKQLARILKKDSSHCQAIEKFIADDLSVLSDFDIHKTCLAYRVSFWILAPKTNINFSFFSVYWTLQFRQPPNLRKWQICTFRRFIASHARQWWSCIDIHPVYYGVGHHGTVFTY